MEYGKYNTLRVKRLVDFGAYLTDGVDDVLLPKRYLPGDAKVNDRIEVFVYFDSEDRPIATTAKPKGQAGEVVSLTVKELNRFGAFLDWGLDKDLFVPFGEMAGKRMAPGRAYAVQIRFDPVSCRIIGSNRFDRIGRKSAPPAPGDPAELTVGSRSTVGYQVVSAAGQPGMLYFNESYRLLRPGDRVAAYVHKVRDDGRIDYRLRAPGRDAVAEAAAMLRAELEKAGGFLRYHGKTDDQVIKSRFGISKRTFKQAVGTLYKARLITLEPDGIRLAPTAE